MRKSVVQFLGEECELYNVPTLTEGTLFEGIPREKRAVYKTEIEKSKSLFWKESSTVDGKYEKLLQQLKKQRSTALDSAPPERRKDIKKNFREKKKILKVGHRSEMSSVFDKWEARNAAIKKRYRKSESLIRQAMTPITESLRTPKLDRMIENLKGVQAQRIKNLPKSPMDFFRWYGENAGRLQQ